MSGSDAHGGEASGLAPVIPLFPGRATPEAAVPADAGWRTTWSDDPAAPVGEDVAGVGEAIEEAERALLRKLRARSLSVIEARRVLHERDLDPALEESLIDRFVDLGYLDDTRLAEQLVHSGSDRKGQGRQAIAMTLAKRGIPRDVSDAVLAQLPDDDMVRALDFARSKVSGMRSLDRETAVRRLSGQLARRGYGGAIALDAARRAWDEASRPSGPRFI